LRYGATTARELNTNAAVGRGNREKRIPVPSANISRPTSDSAVMTMCAGKLFGATLPYPTVPIVSTLKKNARQKGPPIRAGSAPASESVPHARYRNANRVFAAMYPATTIAKNFGQLIVR